MLIWKKKVAHGFLQITPDNKYSSLQVAVISHFSGRSKFCKMHECFDLWHEQIFGLFPLKSRGLTHGKSTCNKRFSSFAHFISLG